MALGDSFGVVYKAEDDKNVYFYDNNFTLKHTLTYELYQCNHF